MLDLQALVNSLPRSLQAANMSELEFWTETELYQWADEAAGRLAREVGCFVEFEEFPYAAGNAVYDLPERHLSTIWVAAAQFGLTPTTAYELDCLNAQWPNVNLPFADRWLQDGEGVGKIRFYPNPTLDGDASIVFHRTPETIDADNTDLLAPLPVAEFLSWSTLSEARMKESDGAMPEAAKAFGEMAKLWLSIADHYWGEAQ